MEEKQIKDHLKNLELVQRKSLEKIELASEIIIPQEKLMELLGVSKSFMYRANIPKHHFPGTKKTFYKKTEVVEALKNFKEQ